MHWYACLSPSTGWSTALPSARRKRRSKVSDLLMHLVYATFGLPTLCHNSGASALQLHWIIRSLQRRHLAEAATVAVAAAAAAQRINGTFEYKLVERFARNGPFLPDCGRFSRRGGSSSLYTHYFGGEVPSKREYWLPSTSLCGRYFLTICAARWRRCFRCIFMRSTTIGHYASHCAYR